MGFQGWTCSVTLPLSMKLLLRSLVIKVLSVLRTWQFWILERFNIVGKVQIKWPCIFCRQLYFIEFRVFVEEAMRLSFSSVVMIPHIFCSFLSFFSLFYFFCLHVLSSSLRPVCGLPTWYDGTLPRVNPDTSKQTFSEPPLHSMLIQIEFKSTQLIFPQLVMVLFVRSFLGSVADG